MEDLISLLVSLAPLFSIFIAIGLLFAFVNHISQKNNRGRFPKIRRTPAHRIHTDTPYELISHFLTVHETAFFRVLLPIASEHNLYVFAKPRIADFVSVTLERYVKNSQWHTYFNMIAMKHIDFLLCTHDLKPIIGFEVDDSSHLRSDRIERDEFIDKLYGSVGLKVVHVFELSDTDKLKQLVTDTIISPADVKENITLEEQTSACPRCGQALSKKVNSKSGEIFFGCNGFPKCRYTKI
jgi:hypothetical protein